MKMGWNKILIAAMALFIIMIVAMGIKMATSSQSLYERDYYEKGESHAERMEREEVAQGVKLTYDYTLKGLEIDFEQRKGVVTEISCIKLSDATEDFKFKPDQKEFQNGTIKLDLSEGIWVLEISGIVEGEKFFKKKQVAI